MKLLVFVALCITFVPISKAIDFPGTYDPERGREGSLELMSKFHIQCTVYKTILPNTTTLYKMCRWGKKNCSKVQGRNRETLSLFLPPLYIVCT